MGLVTSHLFVANVLQDEITHVTAGQKWFTYLCERENPQKVCIKAQQSLSCLCSRAAFENLYAAAFTVHIQTNAVAGANSSIYNNSKRTF